MGLSVYTFVSKITFLARVFYTVYLPIFRKFIQRITRNKKKFER